MKAAIAGAIAVFAAWVGGTQHPPVVESALLVTGACIWLTAGAYWLAQDVHRLFTDMA